MDAGWLNISGLIIVFLLLIPNIIYAIKFRNNTNKCTNTFMNILEQVGRYGCMFLMVFNIGIMEFGFSSTAMFIIYIIGNIVLMIAYWIVWGRYFIKPHNKKQLALAIIPSLIFLLSGITLEHYLLIAAGVIFAVGHIYVTCKNFEKEM